ncbi:hypothetical protein AURDEDRAFT_170319 [Auricularia subglabra TFB-10046 SS5]|nr:hypothetical protein AURDEDRAFT_170319 [Auricularia subglabra TFB-10046 SS5]
MLDADKQALRALLASVYGRSEHPSAADMETLTAEILRETRLFSAETSLQRNNRHATLRFPTEILSLCFSYLPLKGLIVVSHVSQVWRAAAVKNPSLWADIWCSEGDPRPSAWILRLSISRTRALPIRLDVGGLAIRGIDKVLQDCAHRMPAGLRVLATRIATLRTISLALICMIMSSPAPLSVLPPSARPIAERLPAEVLSECLRAADFSTRLRASHVSRTWRAVALADRRLWNTFYCTGFRDARHHAAALAQLKAVLLRSRPLAFDLRIPHCSYNWDSSYHERMVTALRDDVHRFSRYDGPVEIFIRLNPDENPLPLLTSLSILDNTYGSYDDSYEIVPQWGPRCLPNLQYLKGPQIVFPEWCGPYPGLHSLRCYTSSWDGYQRMFVCCPNLVELKLVGEDYGTQLPPPPMPPPHSLTRLFLSCNNYDDTATFFDRLLISWADARIPFVTFEGAASLEGPLIAFLAGHIGPIEASLTGEVGTLRINTVPDTRVWCLSPGTQSEWPFLKPLQTVCGLHLCFLSVSMENIDTFLLSKLTLPGLVELELSLNSALGVTIKPLDRYRVTAPRLRELILAIEGSEDEINSNAASIESLLALLRQSFRSLIVYDASLLDYVSIYISRDCTRDFGCEYFARYAKTYTVETAE